MNEGVFANIANVFGRYSDRKWLEPLTFGSEDRHNIRHFHKHKELKRIAERIEPIEERLDAPR